MPDSADVDALNDDLVTAAQKPQSATIDGNSVNQQSLSDKIEAATYVAAQVASGKGHFGLRFTKLIPPGCG